MDSIQCCGGDEHVNYRPVGTVHAFPGQQGGEGNATSETEPTAPGSGHAALDGRQGVQTAAME